MPTKKRKQVNRKGSLAKPREIPSSALIVSPNITNRYVRGCRFETDTYTTLLQDDLAVTSDGSGIINLVVVNDPTVTLNWGSLKLCFDEMRILAMEVEFQPTWVAGGSTAVFFTPILTVVDLDSSTALTSYDFGMQKGSAKEQRPQASWKREALMSGSGPATFISTSAFPAPNMWVKLYSSGNSATTTVGRVTRRIVAQFRGKGN